MTRRRLATLCAGAALLPPMIHAFAGSAAAPEDAATPSAAAPDAVALGAFVPGAPADPAALDAFAGAIGRMPAFVGWYEAWGSAAAITGERPRLDLFRAVADRGATPMITWEPWDPMAGAEQPLYRPAIIARGDFDAYIHSWAVGLADYGGPVYLRTFHELNADWYPWGIGANDNEPRHLVDAWRRMRWLFDQVGADNVRWVWCVDAGLTEPPLADLYPGDEHVDWVAIDGYNWGDIRPESGWRPFAEVFGPAYAALTALSSRPLMIAETASTERGGDKAAWIADASTALPREFPRVRALGWFDEAQPDRDWPVNSSPAALDAFRKAVAAPAMQGRLP